MLMYNISFCPLYLMAGRLEKVCDLPANSILDSAGETNGAFTRVTFRSSRNFDGWVQTELLEEIVYSLPHNVVEIEYQTVSLQDAAQYVVHMGKIQYNLCGPLSVCSIVGVSLKTLLESWQAKAGTHYAAVFKNGLSSPTGIPDLEDIIALYPEYECKNLRSFVQTWTPLRLQNAMADGWQLIVGVRINHWGRIQPAGIPHWVALRESQPNGPGNGWAIYYNPFSNDVELVTSDVFFASMGVPFGVAVRKK